MPIYYKGSGVGTYWHTNDARLKGFTPHTATMSQTPSRLMQHIARGSTNSPYISLTRSYAIAWDYAMTGIAVPTPTNPGYIYEIEFNAPLPHGVLLLDPVKEVAAAIGAPLDPPYQHDGAQDFLLSVVDRTITPKLALLPGVGGISRSPTLTIEMETFVSALRDAEILVNLVPVICVINRIDVY